MKTPFGYFVAKRWGYAQTGWLVIFDLLKLQVAVNWQGESCVASLRICSQVKNCSSANEH